MNGRGRRVCRGAISIVIGLGFAVVICRCGWLGGEWPGSIAVCRSLGLLQL